MTNPQPNPEANDLKAVIEYAGKGMRMKPSRLKTALGMGVLALGGATAHGLLTGMFATGQWDTQEQLKLWSGAALQRGVLGAVITHITDGGTHYAGFGSIMLTSRNSTLPAGIDRARCIEVWRITAPGGETHLLTDRRSGATENNTVDLAQTPVIGCQTVAYHPTVAGNHDIDLTLYAPDGSSHTATTVTVSVSAPDGTFGEAYVRLDAGGANNGTSNTDAYTNIQDAINAANVAGGKFTIWIAGNQGGNTYAATTALTTVNASNIRIKSYSDSVQEPRVDVSSTYLFNLSGYHCTIQGLGFYSSNADASRDMIQLNCFTNDDSRRHLVGFAILDCIAVTGSNFRNFISVTFNGETWLHVQRCDTSIGMFDYTAIFGSPNGLFFAGNNCGSSNVGSIAGAPDPERPVRINTARIDATGGNTDDCDDVRVSFYMNKIETTYKNAVRYQMGHGMDLVGNRLASSNAATVWLADGNPAAYSPPQGFRSIANEIIHTGTQDGISIKCESDIRSGTGTQIGIVVIATVVIVNNAAANGTAIDCRNQDNSIEFNDLKDAWLIGNFIQSNATGANASCVNFYVTDAAHLYNNIINYNGGTTGNQFTDLMVRFSNVPTDRQAHGNKFSGVGDSLAYTANSGKYLYFGGASRALSNLNSQAWASGNTEQEADEVIASSWLPSASVATTFAQGQLFDYYLDGDNPATIGAAGIVGAVQSVPAGVNDPDIGITESASGGTIDLGSVLIDTPTSQSLTINNDAADPANDLILGTLDVSGDGTLTTDPSDATIAQGGSETATVTIDTSSAGAKSATLTVPSNDADTPNYTVTIEVDVTLPVADIAVDESDDGDGVDLGSVAMGSVQTQDFTIRNAASAPAQNLTLGTLSLTGNGSLTTDPSDSVIAPGASVTATVTMDTASEGAKLATLTIPSDDPDTPSYEIDIEASVMGPQLEARQGPTVIEADATIDLGDVQQLGNHTATLTIQNTGLTDLDLGTVSVTGQLAIMTDPSGTTIGAGESAPLVVRVESGQLGAVSGTVSVPSDAPDSPWGATVQAVIVAPDGPTIRLGYLTVTECTAILHELLISSDLHRRAWDSLNNEDQIKCVTNASIDFDSCRWIGRVMVNGQPTLWPRVDDYGVVILPHGELAIPDTLGTEEWSFLNLPAAIRQGIALQAAARAAEALRVDTTIEIVGKAATGIEGVSGAGLAHNINAVIARQPSSRLHPRVLQLVRAFIPTSVGLV